MPTNHPATTALRPDAEDWGDFAPGDLVEVADQTWEWELIERTERHGFWWAQALCTDRFIEVHARHLTLIESAQDVHDPDAEDDEQEAPSDEEITAYLDSLTDQERRDLAGPLPVRWLYPPRAGEPKRALNLFGGCGGWCAGIRCALGYQIDMVCIDLSRDAVATSAAAGCTAVCADVTTLDPEHPALRWTRILIGSPPCTDWTRAGKRLGHLPQNLDLLLDAIADASAAVGNTPATGAPGGPITFKEPTGESWAEIRERAYGRMTAPTAGLMLEMAIFALGLIAAGAPLETVALEQSNALPFAVRAALWCELELAGWAHNEWIELDAADYGSPSHRRRWFLLVSRHPLRGSVALDAPIVTLASDAIGCAPDLTVITRGNRRTPGGNAFTMGRQVPGITSKIRGWDVGEHGERFTLAQVALLVGMPADHPVVGSRTSACQQLSDIVCPTVATAALGHLLDLPWQSALRLYLSELYPTAHRAATPLPTLIPAARPAAPWQPSLLDAA